jgi:thymidylate synthase (FAD)
MDHIETAILNCYGIREAEQNMVFAARLTQHGHTIQNMADLMDLYRQSYSQKTVELQGFRIQPCRNSWSLP